MLPVIDPISIRDEIERATERLKSVREEARAGDMPDPHGLITALSDLLDMLQQRWRSADDPVDGQPPLGRLGDHGIDLLSRLADVARQLHLTDEAAALDKLTLPLACCIARGGGELTNIAPVVDAAAALANVLREPRDMTELYRIMDDVALGVSPRVTETSAASDSAPAWRLLVINRAIVATRTHEPTLMEAAFDALLEHCPGEAPDFFREGMGQMDALDYPPRVRAVMLRYHNLLSQPKRLH
ncbi:MAG: hypothetical protein K9L70_08810 [Thiohalocapsa sp.]|nr:hypothetical protein [Thiohalocapsa sp.]MCF7991403.1 hypothetical protein [Thiohalocapsa sp.]